MKKVKVGFIGCGGITRHHFRNFEQLQDKAEIVAFCDLDESRAQASSDRFGGKGRVYTDYREMYKNEKLDAVYVCVPPASHDGMEMMAIERGIHLFCQKPMSLDLKYAKKVNAALKKNKIINAVGLQCRYADSLEFVRRYLANKIANNELGMFSAYRVTGMPIVWWWRDKALSGGQVVEQSIHNYDLLRYMLGEVATVQAAARYGVMDDVEDYKTDDATSVILTFKNGVIGTFNSACFYNKHEGDMNFYFRDGKLTYDIMGEYTLTEPFREIKGKASNDFNLESDETFIDVVRGALPQEEILTPYDDALKSLALTLAVNESVDNGGMPVKPAL